MGKFLVRDLAEMGNDVFVTTRSTSYKNNSNGKGSVTYIQGNAHDDDFVENIMAECWDAVVDFMSYSTKEFERRYKFMLDKTGHYIFLSSARVYADSERPITEESLGYWTYAEIKNISLPTSTLLRKQDKKICCATLDVLIGR